MTYSQGGTIEATDYNNFVANINAIWGTGSGANGYGQTSTLSNVTAGSSSVTAGTNSTNPQIYANAAAATNWAGLISRIDAIRLHQSGSASGLTQPTAGTTITYLSTLSANVTSCVTNKLTAASTAASAALGNVANTTAWTGTATKAFSVTFANTDAVRYFFNAGGKIETYARVASGATTKATDWNTFLTNTVGTLTFTSQSLARSGTGGDNITLTSAGFHNITAVSTTYANIGSTSATADYGLNYARCNIYLGGALYGAGSNVVNFAWSLVDAATDSLNDTVSGNTQVFANIVYPETTYLANTWGTATFGTVTNTQA